MPLLRVFVCVSTVLISFSCGAVGAEPAARVTVPWITPMGEKTVVTSATLSVDAIMLDCALEECSLSDSISEKIVPVLRKQLDAYKKKDQSLWESTVKQVSRPTNARNTIEIQTGARDGFAVRVAELEKASTVRLVSYLLFGELVIAKLEMSGDFPESNGRRAFFVPFEFSKTGPALEDLGMMNNSIVMAMALADNELPGRFGSAPVTGSESFVIPCPYGRAAMSPAIVSYNSPSLGRGIQLTVGLDVKELPPLEDSSTLDLLRWYQSVWGDILSIAVGASAKTEDAIDRYLAQFEGEMKEFVSDEIYSNKEFWDRAMKRMAENLWVRYIVDAGPV